MKKVFFIILSLVVVTSVIVPASITFAKSKKVVVPATATTAELLQKYTDAASGKDKVRILIVPGHEPDFGGAEYQGVYEREITVETANQLATYLRQNPRFEVIVARSGTAWDEEIGNYFENEWDDIEDFVTGSKKAFQKLLDKGKVTERSEDDQVGHAAAPNDVALRLYGINRWANENDIDLVVHMHINDAPDHGPNDPGLNSGYAVYVPDAQYGNAAASLPVAEAIAGELSHMTATSTLPVENKGVVEDQELIAIGAFDTLSVPSVLIEYGYITEPRFQHPEVRSLITTDYAYDTYLGIQDFFKDAVAAKYPTTALPFTFATSTLTAASSSPAIYSLQAALHTLGFYPPLASSTASTAPSTRLTLTTCPIDGVVNGCIPEAIKAFQTAKGLIPTGALGPQTTAALNALVSDMPVMVDIPQVSTLPSASSTPSTSACTLPTHSLTLSDTDTTTNGDVSRLQTLLAEHTTYYPQKLITGTFGPATLAAVQKFQVGEALLKAGAPGYGLVGPKTLVALESVCK